jgi:amino acid adenylation domain-containing protein
MSPTDAAPSPMDISPAKRAILEARLRGRNRASTAIARRAPGADAPLSFAQERFWFLDRLGQGGVAYTLPRTLRLPAGVDERAMERALGQVLRRHEAFRTTFREVDGVPVQVIAPFTGFTLPVEDLSALDPAAREAEVRRQAAEQAAFVFDLGAGPLFRARFLRLGAGGHVLLLSTHHIVCDGWSMSVLFRDLWALYDAFRAGREPSLPELPIQYADYAAWQRAQWLGQAHAAQMAYWKERLAGAPALLALPADHPRPPMQTFRGGAVPVRVPGSVLERLRVLGGSERATLYMVVLAAFQLLLSRYAGTDDVVVGTPVAGRTRREVEGLVGLFMNTLVLRTDFSGDPTFRALVGRVREVVLGAYDNQEVPLERLVEELQPERTLSHATLFQVLFQLDSAGETRPAGPAAGAAPDAAPGGGAASVQALEVTRGVSKFDVTLDLDANAHGLGGVLEFSADLFERATAERMVEHLGRVLEQVAENPDLHLSRVRLTGADERRRVVQEWNATAAGYPADRCIHQLFQAQAARTPDAPAVTFAGEALTYRELDERANRLARHLAGLGVGPEVRVGLCLERGLEVMVAILGVMKAGGAYVPVDPSHPAERIAYVMDDSAVGIIITQDRLAERLPASVGVRIIRVDRDWDAIGAESAEPIESGVTSENLAYVIYTSGSTGRPKGVAMHHRGVSNYIDWGIRFYGADAGMGAPVFSSMAVDLTITNLLPLFAGHPVHFLPEENAVEALADAIRQNPGYGLIKITPTHLTLLNDMLSPEDLRGATKTLVVGADFLNAEPTVYWQDHAPDVQLMNEYGPTETVVGCSAYLLPNGVHRAGPVPVGGAIQNLTFFVLDARMEPVPVGLPGELYIGGAGVARGYLGRPGLSAEKFVPDPFAEPGARMYRTGDRARWLEGGSLVILGRTDNQVKIRGYRVELGEVEAAVRAHPDVSACLAVMREDVPGDRRLVAYVVGGAEADALREHLRRRVPEYMVPGAFVRLDALPRTSTGKLDPKTLPAPEYGQAAPGEGGPRNPVEARLVAIWEEMLGLEGIGTTQNFFELGGNSFLALRLLAQVNRRMGSDLHVASLFAGATVRQMADAILEQSGRARSAEASIVALQPEGALPPLYCVHPADRRVLGYMKIARCLGTDQPVYGVQDVGEELSRPVPRIAMDHVQALRARQPEGPYYLAGWSFGGFVAWEMASLLERQGQTVAFLGVLDTMSPLLAQERPEPSDTDLVIGMAGDVAEQSGSPFRIPPGALQGLTLDEQLRRAVEMLHARSAAPRNFDAAALRALCGVIQDRNTSLRGYAPGPFSGTLTLFRAGSVPREYARFFDHRPPEVRRTLGWSGLSPVPVAVHTVPGTHNLIGSEPNVGVLAQRLRESLALARARVHAAEGGR